LGSGGSDDERCTTSSTSSGSSDETSPSFFPNYLQQKTGSLTSIIRCSSKDVQKFPAVRLDPTLLLPLGKLEISSRKMQMGRFGVVYTGLFRNKYRIALKRYTKSTPFLQKIHRELEIYRSVGNHKSIVSLYGWTSAVDSQYIDMIYELSYFHAFEPLILYRRQEIPEIPICVIVAWLVDLSEGLAFLHSNGIVLNSFKLSDILLFDRLFLKIGNLSEATLLSPSSSTSACASCLSTSSLSNTTNKLSPAAPSYQNDLKEFFHCSLQLITRQALSTMNSIYYEEKMTGVTNRSLEHYYEDELMKCVWNFPVNESSHAIRLSKVLLEVHRGINITTSMELSNELFCLMMTEFEGDAREKENSFFGKMKRFEYLIMSFTKDLCQNMSLSKHFSNDISQFHKLLQNIHIVRHLHSRKNSLTENETASPSSNVNVDDEFLIMQQFLQNKKGVIPFKPDLTIIYRSKLSLWLKENCFFNISICDHFGLLFLYEGISHIVSLKERIKNDPKYLMNCRIFKGYDSSILSAILKALEKQK
jgi:serine/threonine protein kinase